jgi:hypothetical protein
MELDDFKTQTQAQSSAKADQNDHNLNACQKVLAEVAVFQKEYRQKIWLETIVAVFAFTAVVLMLVFGDQYYVKIITELGFKPSPNAPLEVHWLMTTSMLMMAIYCIVMPVRLHRSRRIEHAQATSSVESNLQMQLGHFHQLRNIWSTANFWSFLPANLIGVSFFWGLQISLTNSWIPGPYLLGYFILIAFINWQLFRLQKKMLNDEIAPKIKELSELVDCLAD